MPINQYTHPYGNISVNKSFAALGILTYSSAISVECMMYALKDAYLCIHNII